MTSEEDFQRHLDQHPDDHQTRQVLGDFLEEQGDPRANGYRALGKLQKQPHRYTNSTHDPESTNIDHTWFELEPGSSSHFEIPKDWFNLVQGHDEHETDFKYKTFNNRPRQHAEDAAAHAFNQLPPERQAELLGHHDPMLKSRSKPLVVSFHRDRRISLKKYESAPVATVVGEKPYHDDMPEIMKGSRLATVLREIKHSDIGRNNSNLQQLTQHALGGSHNHKTFLNIRDELLRSKNPRGIQLARDYNWHKMSEGLSRDKHLWDFVHASSKGTKHENESTKFRKFYNGIVHGHGVDDNTRSLFYKAMRKHLYDQTGKIHNDTDIQDSLRRLGETEENLDTIRKNGLKGKDRFELPQNIRPAYLGNPAKGKAPPKDKITSKEETAPNQFSKRRNVIRYSTQESKQYPIPIDPVEEHGHLTDTLHHLGYLPSRQDGESEKSYQQRKLQEVNKFHTELRNHVKNNNDEFVSHYRNNLKTLRNNAWKTVAKIKGKNEALYNPLIPLVKHIAEKSGHEKANTNFLDNPHIDPMVRASGDVGLPDEESEHIDLNNPEHHEDDTPNPSSDVTKTGLYEQSKHPFSIEGLGGIRPDNRPKNGAKPITDSFQFRPSGFVQIPKSEEHKTTDVSPDDFTLEQPEVSSNVEKIRREPHANRADVYKSINEYPDLGWSLPNIKVKVKGRGKKANYEERPMTLKEYLVHKHGITSSEAATHIGNFNRRKKKPTELPKPTQRVWPPVKRKSRNIDLMAIPVRYTHGVGNYGDMNKDGVKRHTGTGRPMYHPWYLVDPRYHEHMKDHEERSPVTHEINLDDIGDDDEPDNFIEPDEPTEEPIKESAASAPAGGIIVRGTQYAGGQRIPSLDSKFMNPKMSRRRNFLRNSKI